MPRLGLLLASLVVCKHTDEHSCRCPCHDSCAIRHCPCCRECDVCGRRIKADLVKEETHEEPNPDA